MKQLPQNLLSSVWREFCLYVNAYCQNYGTQAAGASAGVRSPASSTGAAGANFAPLQITVDGNLCRMIECREEGIAVCDVAGQTRDIPLTEQHFHEIYAGLFTPLGLSVSAGSSSSASR